MLDFANRLEFLSEITKKPDFSSFNEAANRIIRLIKDKNTADEPDSSLFVNDYETKLYEAVSKINADDYKTLYDELMTVVPAVNAFFDNVLVMDKDEKIKENRLALLNSLKRNFDKIADFSKISG